MDLPYLEKISNLKRRMTFQTLLTSFIFTRQNKNAALVSVETRINKQIESSVVVLTLTKLSSRETQLKAAYLETDTLFTIECLPNPRKHKGE